MVGGGVEDEEVLVATGFSTVARRDVVEHDERPDRGAKASQQEKDASAMATRAQAAADNLGMVKVVAVWIAAAGNRSASALSLLFL